jgi:DNA-damage-inducible protein D
MKNGISNVSMSDNDIEQLIAAFEKLAYFDENDHEYWLARELKEILDYKRWENFETVIDKAIKACETSGQISADHFREVTKMVTLGSTAERKTQDFALSRFACYLISQNGDPRKKPIAILQKYFAIQTRRQEISDQKATPISEDEKRVFLRNQVKEHNRHLSSAASKAGVITPQDFAIFHSKGYQGLYTKSVPEIRKHKGLPQSADILDRMGSTELAANFFRVTQTEEKLRVDHITGKEKANATHYSVGRQVREAMLKISGIAPENLPLADSITKAEKRLNTEKKKLLKKEELS